ncbi:MAG: hypothetical protein WC107_05875 [Patescibacteria group bacterium]|jgi:hypothetical protein
MLPKMFAIEHKLSEILSKEESDKLKKIEIKCFDVVQKKEKEYIDSIYTQFARDNIGKQQLMDELETNTESRVRDLVKRAFEEHGQEIEPKNKDLAEEAIFYRIHAKNDLYRIRQLKDLASNSTGNKKTTSTNRYLTISLCALLFIIFLYLIVRS